MGQPGIDFPGLGVGLAILRDGKLLLCKRMKAPEAGHWNIVGGKVDHMERAEIAARREAEEETGLSIGPIRYLGITEQLIEADRQHWISLLYVTDDTSGDPQLTEPDKLSEISWFDLDDLPQPLSAFTQTVLTYLR
ncbi:MULTISPECIES: NUDIX domain-containing protein [Rhizobium/Agrobacterium group]|uniref:NUDIX domain-containing protein n=1 Tax=Rhizobium/Agrobacterium group TaxID=227290 RepID=UPI0006B985FA|nr:MULTISPECIES: NUDIX domain-containing protein [Rhizobium/Agrobacterium group]KPF58072.1 DNA mismatch repair protein MutT [Rhizobium sp. AAP116]QGG90718.1 NUDIX domain-containing protein [Agrobacterium sp. MA01]